VDLPRRCCMPVSRLSLDRWLVSVQLRNHVKVFYAPRT
jgi:hypothetical protein